MCTKETANEKASEYGIAPRTARAAMCALCVDEQATEEGSGEFIVHSASGDAHLVDLPAEHCSCKDMEYNEPAGGCYHLRRVRMALGIMEVPEELADDVDPCLRNSREKFGAEPEEPEPEVEPISVADAKPDRAVATDGGVVVDRNPEGSTDEKALPEITTEVEAPEQGGAAYLRCEGCGFEVIGTDESRLPHADDCAHSGGGR